MGIIPEDAWCRDEQEYDQAEWHDYDPDNYEYFEDVEAYYDYATSDEDSERGQYVLLEAESLDVLSPSDSDIA